MQWFSFEDFMPPTGMHIIIVSYKNELAVVEWDSKKMEDSWASISMHYDVGYMPRERYKLRFWMPVSYFDFPESHPSDDDKLHEDYDILHDANDREKDCIARIKKLHMELLAYSDKELAEWIKLPDGHGVRKYHLIREIGDIFTEFIYGPPKPFKFIQENFPAAMLKVDVPTALIKKLASMRKDIGSTSSNTIKFKRYVTENPMFEGMTKLEITEDEPFSLKKYLCRWCNKQDDIMQEYKSQWKGNLYRTYVCKACSVA